MVLYVRAHFFFISYLWEFNFYSKFLIFAFYLLLLLCIFKSLNFNIHFHLGIWWLAWLLSSFLTLPFLLLVTWAAWTWKGHKTHAQPSLCPCGVPENLNLSSWHLGRAWNAGPALDSTLQSNLGSEQCRPRKHTLPWAGANPVWSIHCEQSPHTPLISVCSVPPSPQHNWTSEPK